MAHLGDKLENLISRLPTVDSRAVPTNRLDIYNPNEVGLTITPANILLTLLRARSARDLAVSYRNFNVGGAVFAHRSEPAESKVITGANVKVSPGESDINIHAEKLALKRARHLGYSAISIVAVVGDTQPDTQSGHETCTLHPCGICRNALEESDLINNSRTLIVTALPDFRTIELSTVNRLLTYHGGEAAYDTITQLEIPDLSILHPVMQGNPTRMQDDDATNEEDRVWASTLEPHIRAFRVRDAA